jgi:hypothetical protein
MATLPRYQQMGIQYADLPRVNTAGIDAAARSYDVLAQSLDRMIDFANKRVTTEAEKKAKQYAIDFPPTQDQLNEAVKTGQFPKIEGAGEIFQSTYEASAAHLLSAELQFNVGERAAGYQRKIERGEAVDPAAMKTDMGDMLDGFASVLGTMNADIALKFRAANTTVAHNVYKQAVAAAEKRELDTIQSIVVKSVDNQRPIVRAIFANVGEIAADTGEPVRAQDQLAVIEQAYLQYSGVVRDNAPLDAYYKMIEEEKVQALVSVALQDDFAENDMERTTKVLDGEFGPHKEIWDTMSPEQQKKVQDKLNSRLEAVSKARTSFFNNQTDQGNELERQIYLAGTRTQQLALFSQLKNLAVDPSTIKNVKEYINDGGAGAKVDNLTTLSSLLRRAAVGQLNIGEVVTARNSGLITVATAKSIVIDLSNPNTDITRARQQIKAYSVIEEKDMPEMISDKDARAAALVAENQAYLELMNFSRTPKVDGTLPTSSEVAQKGVALGQGLNEFTLPMLRANLESTAATITQTTLPQLAGVDLMDEAAVEAKIAEILAAPNGAKNKSAILSANNQLKQYRTLYRRVNRQ